MSFRLPPATIRQPVVDTTFLAGVAIRAGRRESRPKQKIFYFSFWIPGPAYACGFGTGR